MGEKASEKELRLRLKDYYLLKKSKSNKKKTAVPASTVTRGKLLQETSQKNQTSKLNGSDLSKNMADSSTATLSNLESEQTDAVMDEDFPDLSGRSSNKLQYVASVGSRYNINKQQRFYIFRSCSKCRGPQEESDRRIQCLPSSRSYFWRLLIYLHTLKAGNIFFLFFSVLFRNSRSLSM